MAKSNIEAYATYGHKRGAPDYAAVELSPAKKARVDSTEGGERVLEFLLSDQLEYGSGKEVYMPVPEFSKQLNLFCIGKYGEPFAWIAARQWTYLFRAKDVKIEQCPPKKKEYPRKSGCKQRHTDWLLGVDLKEFSNANALCNFLRLGPLTYGPPEEVYMPLEQFMKQYKTYCSQIFCSPPEWAEDYYYYPLSRKGVHIVSEKSQKEYPRGSSTMLEVNAWVLGVDEGQQQQQQAPDAVKTVGGQRHRASAHTVDQFFASSAVVSGPKLYVPMGVLGIAYATFCFGSQLKTQSWKNSNYAAPLARLGARIFMNRAETTLEYPRGSGRLFKSSGWVDGIDVREYASPMISSMHTQFTTVPQSQSSQPKNQATKKSHHKRKDNAGILIAMLRQTEYTSTLPLKK
jgi:hypothetical protein